MISEEYKKKQEESKSTDSKSMSSLKWSTAQLKKVILVLLLNYYKGLYIFIQKYWKILIYLVCFNHSSTNTSTAEDTLK